MCTCLCVYGTVIIIISLTEAVCEQVFAALAGNSAA